MIGFPARSGMKNSDAAKTSDGSRIGLQQKMVDRAGGTAAGTIQVKQTVEGTLREKTPPVRIIPVKDKSPGSQEREPGSRPAYLPGKHRSPEFCRHQFAADTAAAATCRMIHKTEETIPHPNAHQNQVFALFAFSSASW